MAESDLKPNWSDQPTKDKEELLRRARILRAWELRNGEDTSAIELLMLNYLHGHWD